MRTYRPNGFTQSSNLKEGSIEFQHREIFLRIRPSTGYSPRVEPAFHRPTRIGCLLFRGPVRHIFAVPHEPQSERDELEFVAELFHRQGDMLFDITEQMLAAT